MEPCGREGKEQERISTLPFPIHMLRGGETSRRACSTAPVTPSWESLLPLPPNEIWEMSPLPLNPSKSHPGKQGEHFSVTGNMTSWLFWTDSKFLYSSTFFPSPYIIDLSLRLLFFCISLTKENFFFSFPWSSLYLCFTVLLD